MLAMEQLRACTTRSDFAQLLGLKPATLSYILYVNRAERRYRLFDIQKRGGGVRHISAPPSDLAVVQRKLCDLLQDCLDELNAGEKRKRDRFSHGFRRRRSIITNAEAHDKRRFVFNTDLADFFPSINLGRVRGYFLKDSRFQLKEDVATVIAQIACYNNQLPQGSPCSPVIANLIAHILDVRLVKLAERLGCTYSRYADDLTFSTNKRLFPSEIAEQDKNHMWIAGSELVRLVKQRGFDLNPSKTRMQYRDSRQEVTGLIVNKKIGVRREYSHYVRAMVDRLIKTGTFEIVRRAVDAHGKVIIERVPGLVRQLHGMLGFIEWVDLYNRNNELKKGRKDTPAFGRREKTYRTFLLYSEFFSATRPVIICEGKTDNVYLVHALRALAATFPQLATRLPSGEVTLNVRLFRYSGTSTGRILGVHGGTADLSKLIWEYHSQARRFTAPGLTQPVIMVIDNDKGATSIFQAAEKLSGRPVKRTEDFLHLTQNLYAVATPLGPAGQQTAIEDCFDVALKSTLIDGKAFDPRNDIDSSTHYGKTVFAHKVVRPNAVSANFDGFKPLLARIASVIDEHAKRVAATR